MIRHIMLNKCALPKKTRKNKELMRRIINNLRKSDAYNKDSKKNVSEIDTQALLVEPVLCLAGYDITNPRVVKRADRGSTKAQFDIDVYDSHGNLKIAIEVKSVKNSIKNDEFNINEKFEITDRNGGSGNLGLCCKNFEDSEGKKDRRRTIIYNGVTWECDSCKLTVPCNEDALVFCNYSGDGVGQLRSYCIKHLYRTPFRKDHLDEKVSEVNSNTAQFIPLLTNGRRWVIFKKDFIHDPFNKITVQDHAVAYADLTAKDFFQTIIKKLRNT
ncbi:MAG: hypothetical protein ABSA46_10275 [Thermodesulfovibrionales bacterium]